MKVALGTVDEDTMNEGHFGESPGFVIASFGPTMSVEWRPNPWRDEPIETRPPKIAALLSDCEAIMVRSIAKEGLQQLSRRFTVLLASGVEVAPLIAALRTHGVGAFRWFDPTIGKFHAPSVSVEDASVD